MCQPLMRQELQSWPVAGCHCEITLATLACLEYLCTNVIPPRLTLQRSPKGQEQHCDEDSSDEAPHPSHPCCGEADPV